MQSLQRTILIVGVFNISPIRNTGIWTVTATDGEKTTTQDVLVDVIAEYEIEMSYFSVLWLYREGDECIDVTGGWTGNTYDGRGSVAKNSDHLSAVTNNAPYANAGFCTNELIDFTGYHTLNIEYELSGKVSGNFFGFSSSKPTSNDDIWSFSSGNAVTVSTNNGKLSLDISSFSGSFYVRYASRHTSSEYGSSNWKAYNIWLE